MGKRGALGLLVGLVACNDSSPPPPICPDLTFPAVTVTEGGSTTFQLWLDLSPGSLSHQIGGAFESLDPRVAMVMPAGFEVSPTDYPAVMTVYGVDDMKPAGNRSTAFDGWVCDNTPTSGGNVEVVDTGTLNVVASSWYLVVPPSATATFDVQLTQAPPSDTTVTLANIKTCAVALTPSTLVFSPATYNAPQTVTVTAGAPCTAWVQLSATNGIAAQTVIVSSTQ